MISDTAGRPLDKSSEVVNASHVDRASAPQFLVFSAVIEIGDLFRAQGGLTG